MPRLLLRNYPFAWVASALTVAGVYEAAYGILITRSSLGISGHFGNPAGFAVFLAALLPFAAYFIGIKKKTSTIFGAVTSGIILTAIILSCSRAGWVAAVVVFAASLWLRLAPIWRPLPRSFKIGVLCFCGLLCTIGTLQLYRYKKDSADGRLLIWRNTIAMIADKPWFGHGPGGFPAQYMLYQAEYFRTHADSRYAPLADNVRTPFNEYLGFAAEYGLVGFVLSGGFLLMALHRRLRKPSDRQRTAALSLLAVGIVALFSYPLYYPAVRGVLVVALIILASKAVDWSAWGLRVLGLVLLATAGWSIIERSELRYYQKSLAAQPDPASTIIEYERLAATRIGDTPSFLYGFAATLNRQQEYARSAAILNRYFLVGADADAAILQTDNYYRMANYAEAEFWTDLAANMCPNRFIPLYYKVMILNETGRREEAIRLARKVLVKPIKVHATDVYKVRIKLQQFIANNE